MTKPSHPPIPPNCAHFYRHEGEPDGDTWFSVFDDTGVRDGLDVCLCHCLPTTKIVIASVARAAWLDIAESQPCHKALSADNFGLHATVRPSQGWLDAMQNARLWKEYGEEKKP